MTIVQPSLFAEQRATAINSKQLERYLKKTHFIIERSGDVSFIVYPFFLFCLPTTLLPEWLRPEQDGAYFHQSDDAGTPCKPSAQANWQEFQARPVVSRLQLTSKFDLVEGSKYDILLDEDGQIHWLMHELLALLTNTATLRFELLSQYAVRLMAGDQMVAILTERIDPTERNKQLDQRMAEQHRRLAEAYKRAEEASYKPVPPQYTALIARATKDGFSGVMHIRDGEPKRLGATLTALYRNHFQQDATAMMRVLIDEHCAWTSIHNKDFTLPASLTPTNERQPHCDCQKHGGTRYGQGHCGDGIYTSNSKSLYAFDFIYVVDESTHIMQILKRRNIHELNQS